MSTDIIRYQTPEEVELNRKREELAAVRAELAEKEWELADFRAQLKSFKGRYLREVGVLYPPLRRRSRLSAALRPLARLPPFGPD
jgi:hypothetical protein